MVVHSRSGIGKIQRTRMDDDGQILCVVKKVGTARAFGIECNDFYTWAELDNQ
jgi:hypothetical protein